MQCRLYKNMVYSKADGWLLRGLAVADPAVDMAMILYHDQPLLGA